MNQEQIDRINALYRKSKAEGLTEEEKKEQALLRKQYVADLFLRKNVQGKPKPTNEKQKRREEKKEKKNGKKTGLS